MSLVKVGMMVLGVREWMLGMGWGMMGVVIGGVMGKTWKGWAVGVCVRRGVLMGVGEDGGEGGREEECGKWEGKGC